MTKERREWKRALTMFGVIVGLAALLILLTLAGCGKEKETAELPPFEEARKERMAGVDLLSDYEGEFVRIEERVAVYVREFADQKKDGDWAAGGPGELLETYKGDLLWENVPDYRWYYDENGEEKDGLPPLKWSIETESDWYSVKGEDNLELLIREQTSGRISLWEFEKFVASDGIDAFMCATMFPDVTNYTPYTDEDVVRLIYKGNAPRVVVEPSEAFEDLMRYFRGGPGYNSLPEKNLVHGVRADSFPDDFSGAYVDGENLVILLPESLSAEEAEQSADRFKRWLRPRRTLPFPENIVFKRAEYTYRELAMTTVQILDYKEAADAAEEYTVGKCGIDDRNNRVIVYLNEVSDGARSWFAEHVTDAACVEFRVAEK